MGAFKELYIQACENVLCGAVPSTPDEEAAVVAEASRLAAELVGGKAKEITEDSQNADTTPTTLQTPE